MRVKTVGTKNSVATVAKTSPPITARPSGAFCSPPSPMPSAMGTMPMIIASAVINTGRKRVTPACRAAWEASSPASMRWRAKLTTRTLLAVATPMHMIAPVRAGTLTGVCVRNSIHTIPPRAAGRAVMMMNGSSQDWKFTDQQVDQHDRGREPEQQTCERLGHGLHLAAHGDLRAVWQGMLRVGEQLVDLRGHEPEVGPLDGSEDVDHRSGVVMAHDRRRHAAMKARKVGEQLRAVASAAGHRSGGRGGAGDRCGGQVQE